MNNTPMPKGKFDLIVADPPWQYDFKFAKGRPETHYQTMGISDICALDVAGLAAEDCLLYLWVTAQKIAYAWQAMQAWGFQYKTQMVWVKTTKNNDPAYGMGFWARNSHELLYIAARGKPSPPPQAARRSSVIQAPRRKHSQKPEVVMDMLDDLYPNARKLELFSRRARLGWSVWGNEMPQEQQKGE